MRDFIAVCVCNKDVAWTDHKDIFFNFFAHSETRFFSEKWIIEDINYVYMHELLHILCKGIPEENIEIINEKIESDAFNNIFEKEKI